MVEDNAVKGNRNMSEPLVSIIVPVYNQEMYLRKSIPSLLEQEYRNIQIVIVNDGSTDQSDAIITEYADADSRIKIVRKENGGLVDATICGIHASEGEYIAFLDPDDYVGRDFISNFMKELDQDYDFVASGFYYDKGGSLSPYLIEKTLCYDREAIKKLSGTYLYHEKRGASAREIFHSQWNKLYKAETVNKVIPEFEQCKEVTLGEDTIFTYLLLMQSKKGKSVKGVNSYYYNIGNPNSMMNDENILNYLQKARIAYIQYSNIIKEYGGNENGALALYFLLLESLYSRLRGKSKKFLLLYKQLKKDVDYRRAVKYVQHTTLSRGQKIDLLLRFHYLFSLAYQCFFKVCIFILRDGRHFCQESKLWIRDCIHVGIKKARYLKKFREQRKSAAEDLTAWMPELDKRITEIIKRMDLKPEIETIECNVFVFWWDGFESAPLIVKRCLESVRQNYKDYNIIPISKDNYQQYTDIDGLILEDYAQGRISVQSFSDVLRFNLLKNHGGMWIDATIFAFEEFDLIRKLDSSQSFNSLEFSSSKEFLQYKGYTCSWSSFFIASKKNGLFVRTMDLIFREYYRTFRSYTLYYFMDAAYMVCKINGIDCDVLTKIQKCDGDMFLLLKVGNQEFEKTILPEICRLPQKLAWNISVTSDDGEEKTFYDVLLRRRKAVEQS